MAKVAIVGTGFVADLYMRSLMTFPWITVVKAYDIDKRRLATFCNYWQISPAENLAELLDGPGSANLVLNLTNPGAHFEISKLCLEAGRHVYSEKPLANTMSEAITLHAVARDKGLLLASAPCSVLGEAAQTLWLALRRNAIGKPYLAYAELDDDLISRAPYKDWFSESGAPWPYRDEFHTGCTIEHAGYYLTWLMAMFGAVSKVVAASAKLVNCELEGRGPAAPDFSTATLFFDSGTVARLTCSIVAPHNHRLQIIGERGLLEVADCWDNVSEVRIRRRHRIRRRLISSPFTKRVRISGRTHPKVSRRGATSMNFALGPAEMLEALKERRPCRLSADFALHLNEVTLAIHNARDSSGAQNITTSFSPMEPMPWACEA
jgi:predicted dehydrogenase